MTIVDPSKRKHPFLRLPQSGARTLCRPRGPDLLRKLFRQQFPGVHAAYEQRYTAFFGRFRLPLAVPIAATTCSVPSRARASSFNGEMIGQ